MRRVPVVLALLLIVPACAAPASADDTLLTRPAAAVPVNLSAYGSTMAWSEKSADGTYRLIVRTGDGAPAAAPIPAFDANVDPDVGPATGGDPVIVYSRCTAGAACDVWRYTPATGVETRIAAVASRRASETAPSIHQGAVLYAKTGGTYLYRPGRGTRRISTARAAATDLSPFRTAMLTRGEERTVIRMGTWGRAAKIVATGTVADAGGERFGAPVFTRYFLYWRSNVTGGDEISSVLRVNIRRAVPTVERSTRTLPAGLDLAVAQRPSGLFWYFDPDGLTGLVSPADTALKATVPALTFG